MPQIDDNFYKGLFQKACQKLRLSESETGLNSGAAALNACVTSSNGEILWVNQAWRDFGAKNGNTSDHIGDNYFRVINSSACAKNEVATFVQKGLFWLLEKLEDYYFAVEYPCHSEESQAWFEANFVKVSVGCKVYLVVLHSIIAPTRFPELAQDLEDHSQDLLNSDTITSRHFVGECFHDIVLRQKDLSGSDFVCVEFRNCRFENCNFKDTQFLSCAFLNCSFENCNWSGVQVKNCTFESVHFGCSNVYRDIHFEKCRAFLTSGFEKCDTSFFNRGMVAVFP